MARRNTEPANSCCLKCESLKGPKKNHKLTALDGEIRVRLAFLSVQLNCAGSKGVDALYPISRSDTNAKRGEF